ncbi:MAG: penicillin-binding protein 1A, partial [Alphaproteobacteria bacterium]|nr:penicillin-binding protein 1A [Alphaproteobacteria bacterium]
MRVFGKFILWCVSLGLLGLICGSAIIIGVFLHYSQDLPDHSFLKDYEPPVVTRVHTGDGRLLAEFAQERRIFVPIEEMPELVKNAFLAAEDQNFYTHPGVDFKAVMRAVVINLKNYGSGKRMVGASTISQQVAKNFLLTNERSFERKIREAIVAYRMDKAMSKDRILELYLNEIFLGNRSYGVGAAGLNYFNKPLDKLTISEAAYLAALPKAPSRYNPVRNYDAALGRRDWVIGRMAIVEFITDGQAELAKATPLQTKQRDKKHIVEAPYFAEEVRRKMIEAYDKDSIYKQGLSIRTTVNPEYQELATQALRDGLKAYDRRHGWRGPVKRGSDSDDFLNVLIQEGMLKTWELALVKNKAGAIKTQGGTSGTIQEKDLKWAKRQKPLKSGDVVMVEKLKDKAYALHQVPKIQGAIIVMDPHTGRVLAMQGGWNFGKSEYNRATQAERQPGSAFKPFVYLAALEEGLTPSTRILDAPFEYEDRPGNIWRPKNYSNKYYGITPLRVGIEKSKNLMTVRLAHHIGMDKIVETATRFGVDPDLKPLLANSLGASETTLLNITSAYAMLVNGGKKISPTFIDRIQNRYGETIFQHDNRTCPECGDLIQWEHQAVPTIPDGRESVSNPQNVYQIVSILEGVVERGTGRRLRSLNRPLAGKTGTTNESRDAWFIGFSPDLAVG